MRALKKLLTITALTLPLVAYANTSAADEDYIGTGATQKEARENLANNIQSSIKSDFQDDVTNVTNSRKKKSFLAFTSTFSKYSQVTKTSSHHQTNVILTGITFDENKDENGYFVARLNKAQFKKDTEQTISNIEKSCAQEFPSEWTARHKAINQCQNEIDAAIGMARVALPQKEASLNKLRTQLADLAAESSINVQSSPSAPFTIANHPFDGNTTLNISAGSYTIAWNAPGFCQAEQKVTAKSGERITVKQKLRTLPTITVKSSVKTDKINLAGTNGSDIVTKTFDQCEGSISYTVSNRDTHKTGTITLKPGLNRTVSVDLLTQADLDRLTKTADSFQSLNQYNIIYGYSFAKDFEGMHRLKLENIRSYSALRYGYGVLYGKGKENVREYGAYGQLALQLTHLGETPLHISRLAVIPYAGVEAGIGYHERYHTKGEVKVHNRYSSSKSFASDHLSLKYLLGFDFPINEKFSIKLQGSKNIRNAKDVETAIGASIQF